MAEGQLQGFRGNSGGGLELLWSICCKYSGLLGSVFVLEEVRVRITSVSVGVRHY